MFEIFSKPLFFQIPFKLIENLEDKAQEIEAEFIEFIQKVPLNYHPSRRGNVISIGFPAMPKYLFILVMRIIGIGVLKFKHLGS